MCSRQVLSAARDDVRSFIAEVEALTPRYIDSESMQLAMSPGWNCQYIQINLGNTARHDEIFTPPTEWQGVKRDWKRFDYVFDFSGETGFDKAELVSQGKDRRFGPQDANLVDWGQETASRPEWCDRSASSTQPARLAPRRRALWVAVCGSLPAAATCRLLREIQVLRAEWIADNAAANLEHVPDRPVAGHECCQPPGRAEAARVGAPAPAVLRDEVVELVARTHRGRQAEAGRKPWTMVARGAARYRCRSGTEHGCHPLCGVVRAGNVGL